VYKPDPDPRLDHLPRQAAIRVELRIRAELYGSDKCSTLGIAVRAYAPVLELCRQLVAAGHNPASRLEAYRLDVLCLTVRSIGEAADLEINGRGTGLKRRRAAVGAASPVAPIGPRASPSPESVAVAPARLGAPRDDGLEIPAFLLRRPA
jgi:hypothetical protein